jgi:hypothetical protein
MDHLGICEIGRLDRLRSPRASRRFRARGAKSEKRQRRHSRARRRTDNNGGIASALCMSDVTIPPFKMRRRIGPPQGARTGCEVRLRIFFKRQANLIQFGFHVPCRARLCSGGGRATQTSVAWGSIEPVRGTVGSTFIAGSLDRGTPWIRTGQPRPSRSGRQCEH